MESGRNSLMMESRATAPGCGEPAALNADGSVKLEAGAAANQALLGRLLAMAQRYRGEGNLREAMELFWELAENHPGTAEADAAGATLLELAASYERNAAPHMARSMYERLMGMEG